MDGAKQIEPNFLRSHFLINVDSEEDWRICVGCAGGLLIYPFRAPSSFMFS